MDRVQHQLTFVSIALCLVAAACGNDGKAGRAEAAVHVDSSVAPEIELARFREGLAAPAGLTGGASSRDALVSSFIRGLEARDSIALGELLLTRAEFAYLYYPTHPEARAPYNLSPGLMWFMLDRHSRRGLNEAWEQRGDRPLMYLGYSCAQTLHQGENTVWTGCMIKRRDGAGIIEEALFGPIVERGGTYKFVSYANKL
jgi:hypothetical protein